MKETGIIMSGNHPKLILDGIKTRTRRTYGLEKINKDPDNWIYLEGSSMVNQGRFTFYNDKEDSTLVIKCPYGQVGDRLVIKETGATENQYNHLKPSEVPRTAKIWYLADEQYNPQIMGKVRSAMFMCLWMSRARPEIIEVRVERVQEITSWDARAEGVSVFMPNYMAEAAHIHAFRKLWDSLNAKRGYGWEVNPWVWVISFRKI